MKLYTAKVRVSTKKQEPSETENALHSTTPPQVCGSDTRIDDIAIVARDIEDAIDELRLQTDDADILCVHASEIRVIRSMYV